MVTSVRWKWFLLPILGIALLAGGVVVQLEAGKPGGGGGGTPPVQYEIQFWTWPQGDGCWVNKMNDYDPVTGTCQVVGHCWFTDGTGENHGFLYDPSKDPNTAIDLNAFGISNIPDGWMISSAVDINNNGVIVGSLLPKGSAWDNTVKMGFILDTKAASLALERLPDPLPSAYWTCMRINNSNDVLVGYKDVTTGAWGAKIYHRSTGTWGVDLGVQGVFLDYLQMNDSGQVALQLSGNGGAYRWDPPSGGATSGTLVPIGGNHTTARGINVLGTVCGSTVAKVKGLAMGTPFPFRFLSSLEVLSSQAGNAVAINSDQDLFGQHFDAKGGYDTGRPYVYQDRYGFLALDSLIDPTDAADAATWASNYAEAVDMNNRTGTPGFGQVTGRMYPANNLSAPWGAYLLTPKQSTP